MNARFNKYFFYIFIIGVLVAILIWNSVYRQANADFGEGKCKISFLDVGQADSTLISLPNNIQILVDGGLDSSTANRIEQILPPFDQEIEYVIATHPDSDHIGGLAQILQSYKVGEFIQTNKTSTSQTYVKLQEMIIQKKLPLHIAKKGETIVFSEIASSRILSPDEGKIDSLSSNDSSIVMRFACQNSFVILAGDAQIPSQDEITRSFTAEELHAQIFHMAHHGAQNAFDENLILKVKPTEAIISVGPNSYGHPSKFTIDELTKMMIKILRTDKDETINFVSDGTTWQKK